MRGGGLARGAVEVGHAADRVELGFELVQGRAVFPCPLVVGLNHVDRGAPGPGACVIGIFARRCFEVPHCAGEIVAVLLQGRAHHENIERRRRQVPPRLERRLRIAYVPRVPFRAGKGEIALGKADRRFPIARVGGQIGTQLAQLAGDRIPRPHGQSLEHRCLVLRHVGRRVGGGRKRRDRQSTQPVNDCADDGCPESANGCG